MLIFGMYINEHMLPNTFSQIRIILVLLKFFIWFKYSCAARAGPVARDKISDPAIVVTTTDGPRPHAPNRIPPCP